MNHAYRSFDEWLHLNKEAREASQRCEFIASASAVINGPGLVSDFRRGTRLPQGKRYTSDILIY